MMKILHQLLARRPMLAGAIAAIAAITALVAVGTGCGTEPVAPCAGPSTFCLPAPDSGPQRDAVAAGDAAEGDGARPDVGMAADSAPDAVLQPDGPYAAEQLTVAQAEQLIAAGQPLSLVDVREPAELADTGYIAGATNLTWTSGGLKASYAQLPTDRPTLVYCRSGHRGGLAATFLASKGYRPVYNLTGGILAWIAAGKPVTK